jgi:hypothetical protein
LRCWSRHRGLPSSGERRARPIRSDLVQRERSASAYGAEYCPDLGGQTHLSPPSPLMASNARHHPGWPSMAASVVDSFPGILTNPPSPGQPFPWNLVRFPAIPAPATLAFLCKWRSFCAEWRFCAKPQKETAPPSTNGGGADEEPAWDRKVCALWALRSRFRHRKRRSRLCPGTPGADRRSPDR